ncbi:MAG: septum formation initiator family protein [Firmicutes bacterium]|nr:septum formation initiator family protein [Bacillota bacterium]
MPPRSKEPMRQIVTVQPKFLLFVALVLALIFGIAFSIASSQVRRMNEKAEAVQRQVVEAKAYVEELERRLAFAATDEYVAQEARRRFGYMEEGEIRFIVDGEMGYALDRP